PVTEHANRKHDVQGRSGKAAWEPTQAAPGVRSMGVMTSTQHPVRASDAEREEVARIVQTAGGDGRLTLAETEERLAGIYQTRFRHELTRYTEDLPSEPRREPGFRPIGRPRGPLAVHAAIVVVLAVSLIAL